MPTLSSWEQRCSRMDLVCGTRSMLTLLIGGIETLDLVADQLSLDGLFWSTVRTFNGNFGSL